MQATMLKNTPKISSYLLQAKAGEDGTALANALRRLILTQLESFAIEDVVFYENSSALYNEYIANRLALVPLTWEDGVADDARISFTLSMDGPCIVYSRDLKSTDEKIVSFNGNIPLVVLGLDQRLRLEAVAVKGTGKSHAKFQCAHASYAQVASLAPAKKIEDELIVHEYPPSSQKPEDFSLAHPELCDFNLEYVKIGEDIYKVNCKEDEFLFFVESYNNAAAKDHFERAVALLAGKLSELSKELK